MHLDKVWADLLASKEAGQWVASWGKQLAASRVEWLVGDSAVCLALKMVEKSAVYSADEMVVSMGQ